MSVAHWQIFRILQCFFSQQPCSLNSLTSKIFLLLTVIIHQQVNVLALMWKSNMHQWQETHCSLSLIIFYDLIFCLIDFSSFSLSLPFSVSFSSSTTQEHRQLGWLVNPDKEAESTSWFDIYGVIFTTSLYNLCPFTLFSLYFISSHAHKLNGNFYMLCLTERGHKSRSQQFSVLLCEAWGV